MYKKILAVAAAALLCVLLPGCSANEVPHINSSNPALTASGQTSSYSSSIPPQNSSTTSSSTNSSSSDETVSSDFKAKMDSYGALADEYVKCAGSYDSSKATAAEYSELLELYEEFHALADEIAKLEKSGLSDADAKYYKSVSERVAEMISVIDDKKPEAPASSLPSSSSLPVPGSSSTTTTPKPSSTAAPKPSVPGSTTTVKPITTPPTPSTVTPSSVTTKPSTPGSSSTTSQSSGSLGSSSPSSASSSSTTQNPVTDTSSLLNNYTRKWAYNQLNSTQQAAYVKLFESAQVHGESADVSGIGLKKSDVEKVYWAFDYDNAQFLALGSGFGYSYNSSGTVTKISIRYGRSAGEIADIQPEFNATAQAVIAEAKKLGSGYEQLKYVHDWIINNTVYMSSGPLYKSEADGVVVYGKALCEGYSKAFMYFAQSLGYECVCIAGYAGEEHMWNMVKLDGSWYHVDVTWDDPISSTGADILRYDYFLVGDSTISSDHRVDNIFTAPTAPRDYT